MDDLYRENIMDHYKNPRNFGTLEDADISYSDSNPLCGDEITLQLKLDNGIVEDVRFNGKGCAISMAAASMLTEMIQGQKLDELKNIGKQDMTDLVGVTLGPVRVKCALLALKVLKAGAYGLHNLEDDEL